MILITKDLGFVNPVRQIEFVDTGTVRVWYEGMRRSDGQPYVGYAEIFPATVDLPETLEPGVVIEDAAYKLII